MNEGSLAEQSGRMHAMGAHIARLQSELLLLRKQRANLEAAPQETSIQQGRASVGSPAIAHMRVSSLPSSKMAIQQQQHKQTHIANDINSSRNVIEGGSRSVLMSQRRQPPRQKQPRSLGSAVNESKLDCVLAMSASSPSPTPPPQSDSEVGSGGMSLAESIVGHQEHHHQLYARSTVAAASTSPSTSSVVPPVWMENHASNNRGSSFDGEHHLRRPNNAGDAQTLRVALLMRQQQEQQQQPGGGPSLAVRDEDQVPSTPFSLAKLRASAAATAMKASGQRVPFATDSTGAHFEVEGLNTPDNKISIFPSNKQFTLSPFSCLWFNPLICSATSVR